ncbi:MAG TPA: polynucleotide adenylyltransferase PcnB, partial [Planctomycetota bacterium]|nr:polynucleotide adenylyltransferase PcnB [Planctomycetota bacterium]
MTEASHPEPVRYGDTIIFPASLDPDAVHVVRRLCEAGLESYLVGGCVRDLLLGLIPKDFDISTEARPRQIRRLFRNSRIIGRRFKLAHIHFHDKVIEVATFRRSPDGSGAGDGHSAQGDDLLITRDNEFGDAREDALRRDFTINALLFDVRSAEVIDHVGGVHDLTARVLRTIGDPAIRLAEDPVRMLRAVKFAARLQLGFDPELDRAMTASAELIRKSAPPRVIEEIYKMLTCGAAERALPLLQRYGLFERLLPDIAECWREHPAELAATGRALDLIDRGRRRVSNAFLLAALLLRPWHARVMAAPGGDPVLPAHDLLDPVAQHMSIPRRDVAIAKHLLIGVLRMERPRRGRRPRGEHQRGGGEPLALLYLGALTGVLDPELHARWVQRLLEGEDAERPHDEDEPSGEGGADAAHEPMEGAEPAPGGRSRRGRRRRRGGRRHRGGREQD